MKYTNPEAERALIGSMVMDNSIIENVSMEIADSDFSIQSNRMLFDTIRRLNSKRFAVDVKTLYEELKATEIKPLEIATLTDVVPSGANWAFYTKVIKKHSLYRGYVEILEQAKEYNPDSSELEIGDQIVELNKAFARLAEASGSEKLEKSMYEVMLTTEKEIQRFIKNKGKLTGYKSGFPRLDFYTNGIQKNFIIIGARPSIGKSSLIETLMINIAKLNNVPVCLFEIEMTEAAIGLRAVSGEAQINSRHIRSGFVNKTDRPGVYTKMGNAMVELSGVKFFLDDKTNEIHKLASRIRYMARCKGVQVFGIDHLSIIKNTNNKMPRHEQMADIVEILRELKKELGVTIILLAQLRRETEGSKPCLADLRETGAAEQSAEDVWMLYRERQADIDQKAIPTKLMIMKQREGPCGDLDLIFNTETVKFYEQDT
jgi:replicative DNA helicase